MEEPPDVACDGAAVILGAAVTLIAEVTFGVAVIFAVIVMIFAVIVVIQKTTLNKVFILYVSK